MSICQPVFARILSPLLLLLALTPTLSYGVDCVEFFEDVGRPAAFPGIDELTSAVSNDIILDAPVLTKLRIRATNDGDVLLTFPKNSASAENKFDVFAVQSSRPYFRPKFSEIEGYRRYADDAAESVEKNVKPGKPLINTKSRLLAYGLRGAEPKMIRLSGDESPVALLVLGNESRIVATVEKNHALGFKSGKSDSYLVQLYYLDLGGYASSTMRIPFTEKFPTIEFFNAKKRGAFLKTEAAGLIMRVDEKLYSVTLAK